MKSESLMWKILFLLGVVCLLASDASAGFKEGGGDQAVFLVGAYRDTECELKKPRDPEQNCPFLKIMKARPNGRDFDASGAVSGGDVLSNYTLSYRPVKMSNGYVYEVVIRSESGDVTHWLFLEKAQKLVNLDTGVNLSRVQTLDHGLALGRGRE